MVTRLRRGRAVASPFPTYKHVFQCSEKTPINQGLGVVKCRKWLHVTQKNEMKKSDFENIEIGTKKWWSLRSHHKEHRARSERMLVTVAIVAVLSLLFYAVIEVIGMSCKLCTSMLWLRRVPGHKLLSFKAG